MGRYCVDFWVYYHPPSESPQICRRSGKKQELGGKKSVVFYFAEAVIGNAYLLISWFFKEKDLLTVIWLYVCSLVL